jgi:hypothetical protein
VDVIDHFRFDSDSVESVVADSGIFGDMPFVGVGTFQTKESITLINALL